MTREHDALRDLLAPVALGAATADEAARVEAHAAECAVCREELAGLRAAADVLALAVPQREPSPELRASLMATVRAEAAEREAAADRAAAPPPRRSEGGRLRGAFSRVRPWPAIATVAAVAALLLGGAVALQTAGDEDGQEVTELAVSGTPDAPGITGEVLYVPEEQTAVVRLRGLPDLPPGDAYQLWVLRDGMANSAGLFEPDGPGQAIRVAEGLAGADALAVTAQPRTSRLMPERPILVQAPLPA
jgi:Anti-sigma-K factor rskA/Putative zinc-finger